MLKKYHRERILLNESLWVIRVINNFEKVFKIINKKNKNILKNIIINNVISGSIVVTNIWRRYNQLNSLGYVYKKSHNLSKQDLNEWRATLYHK